MTWHILCLDNETERYNFQTTDTRFVLPVPLNHPTHPNVISNNIKETLSSCGLSPSDEATDLLNAAISVYTADTRVIRSSAYDNWTRDFVLHLPVRNPELWENAVPILKDMLTFLTGDHWDLQIRKSKRTVQRPTKLATSQLPKKVSLFSGGLDSFVGAVDLLEEKEPVLLVSHYTSGPLSDVQKQVYKLLSKEYPGLSEHLRFRVQPPKNSTEKTELTTRSRSILFMALGIAVASALGIGGSFYVPENGLISLNVPLTHTRTSSLSTRTTHPYFMELFRSLLSVLGLEIKVETPYQFQTKGEMLKNCKNQKLIQKGAILTMSCSHPGVGRHIKGGNPFQHCGYCVPCIIRRASMAAVGMDSPSPYGIDVLTQPPSPESGTGRDFRAFEMALARRREPDYRPLLEVINAGPIPGRPDGVAAYVDVFQRGMEEVENFLVSGRVKS